MHVDRWPGHATVGGTIVEDDAAHSRGPHFRRRVVQRWIQVRRLRMEEEMLVLTGPHSDGHRDPEPGAHRVAAQSHGIQFRKLLEICNVNRVSIGL